MSSCQHSCPLSTQIHQYTLYTAHNTLHIQHSTSTRHFICNHKQGDACHACRFPTVQQALPGNAQAPAQLRPCMSAKHNTCAGQTALSVFLLDKHHILPQGASERPEKGGDPLLGTPSPSWKGGSGRQPNILQASQTWQLPGFPISHSSTHPATYAAPRGCMT
jgi:hypothetical protein